MPTNVYSSLIALLRTNAIISPLLGDYKGFKSVFAGTRPEDSDEFPTITITGQPSTIEYATKTNNFTLNVYVPLEPSKGGGEAYGMYLQEIIMNELDGCSFTIDGVTMLFRASGIGNAPNPVDREINTPINLRVTNWSC